MRCRTLQKHLSAYLDGELDARQNAQIQAHVAQCESCSLELARLRKAYDALLDGVKIAPDPFFITRLRARLAEDKTKTAGFRWNVQKLVFPASVAAAIFIGAILGVQATKSVLSSPGAADPSDEYFESETLAAVPSGSLTDSYLNLQETDAEE